MQRTSKCGKKMMPLIGGFVMQRTLAKWQKNDAPHWRTLSNS
jgi:hypothetical protein